MDYMERNAKAMNMNYMAQTEDEKGGGFRGRPRRWTGKG